MSLEESSSVGRRGQRFSARPEPDHGTVPDNYDPDPVDGPGTPGLSSVEQVIEALTSTQDLSLASGLFLSEVQKLADCQIASVFSIDESADAVTTVLFASIFPVHREVRDVCPLTGSQMERRFKATLPFVEQAGLEDSSLQESREYLEAGIRSTLWVPLIHKENPMGIIALHSRDPNAFDNRALDRIKELGHRLAPSLASAAGNLQAAQQQEFAQALGRVSRALTSNLNTDQVLLVICQECCSQLRASAVVLREAAGGELVCRLAWPPGVSQPHDVPVPLDRLVTRVRSEGANTGQDGVANEKPSASDSPGLPSIEPSGSAGARSVISLPLMGKGQLIGVLEISHTGTGRGFTRRCQEIAGTFAAHAAIALQNARLNEELDTSARHIAIVDEVARIVTSTLNVDEVYERFAAETRKLVDFDRISISVINTAGGTYTVKHVSGLTRPGHGPGDTIPLAGTETHKVITTGLPSITDDLATGLQAVADQPLLEAVLRSRIILPLKCRGRSIGTLVLHSRRSGAFGAAEQALLERLAHQIAPAVDNARLYEETLREKDGATKILAQFKAVLKEVDAGVLLVNDRRQVLWMNERFGEIFGVDDIESILKDDRPAPMSALRERDASCFADPDAFFAERDRIDADRVFAGCLGSVEIIRPEPRILQEFTAPVYDAEQNYVGRLWVYNDITAQKRSEEALRRSQAQQRALLDAVPDAMFRIGKDGTYLDYIAPSDFHLWQLPEEFLGQTVEAIMPAEIAQRSMDSIRKALSSRQVQTLEYQLCKGDRVRAYEARIVASGEEEVLAIVRDVTERKFWEAEFLQSQKLESLGRLAGGIAHDFNNLLGGIMGYASLLKGKLDPTSEAHEFASIIEKATQRGAQLTQQLLTAARRGTFDPRPVGVNEVMEEIVQILSHTLPKEIEVVARLQPDLPSVQGDQTQIHQVLMNLCINAADAMPEGGTLTLSNQEVSLDDAFCQQHLSIQPGRYVQLAVADTGIGIDEMDKSKIFDPFFTTKEPGKGTGLGLAVVYAIVKNHQGLIEVSSTLGEGSLFTVYLPVYEPGPP